MSINDINKEDYEYTIVLDGSYFGPDADDADAAAAGQGPASPEDPKAAIDRMYSEYEAMCLKEPTVIDVDDAYPHTYYWRIGSRYDPEKVKVVKEALKQGKRISDTEAFEEYSESVRNRRYSPESWD